MKTLKFILLLTIVAFFVFFLGLKLKSSPPSKQRPVVAITQIAPHPSLDAIRKGITDEVKKKFPNVEIIFHNAQGNMATATQIARNFVSIHPKVIVPITTPSAQSVYAASKDKNIPIVFAGVSDAVFFQTPHKG